jgi:signal peptidase I
MLIGRFKVSGHSMEPYLKEGDEVIVLGFLGIKKGDVVVFKYNSKNFIKRVKKISNKKYFVEGDNKEYFVVGDNKNDSLDISTINKKDILGKVICKLP